MRIGVDVDGVLADSVTAFLGWHNRVYGTNYTFEQVTDFDLSKLWGGTNEESVQKIITCYTSPEFEAVQPVLGAVEAIKKLAKDHELIIITARPASMIETTKNWICMFFPEMFDDIYFNDCLKSTGVYGKKQEQMKEAKIELLIDDALKNVSISSEIGIPSLLLDYPWNQSDDLPKGVTRVKNWKEIVEIINSQEI
jgi:uncharacterized HAD superfamily protein